MEDLQSDEIDETEIGDLTPLSVLFQTGFLTIKSTKIEDVEPIFSITKLVTEDKIRFYSLKVPNQEVGLVYSRSLFKNLFPLLFNKAEVKSCRNEIVNAITSKNAKELAEILQAHLATIPYPLHAVRKKMWKSNPKLGEFLFHAIFLSFFSGLGLKLGGIMKVVPEAVSSEGRSDIDIILSDDVYAVFELKYMPAPKNEERSHEKLSGAMDEMADAAITQLKNTLQDKKYNNQASKIISAGIVICGRDIVSVKFAEDIPASNR
ncbi:MAG: PD-(D/E)XK nuclease domain-containing protein [Deltaproteobacteria bacterium]|jgi:hypothetical protein|nr:PD-(D/E)XK nuclease domain-containing protein [Deltaproteobacteria bacterium]